MDSKREQILLKRALEPFDKEARSCLFSYLLTVCVLSVAFTVFCLLYPIPELLLLLPAFIGFGFLFNAVTAFRRGIFAFIEHKANKYKAALVTIVDITGPGWTFTADEPSWGGSRIRKLYPESLHMGRYRIVCRSDTGKRLLLHTAMSRKKYQVLRSELCAMKLVTCTVHYGAYSKIVFFYESKEPWADKMNHMM